MLRIFPQTAERCSKALWVDLLNPTPDESRKVAHELGVEIPFRPQLEEIESSSRLQVDGDSLRMSMPVSAHGEDARSSPLGFVFTQEVLVTLRFSELRSFDDTYAALGKNGAQASSSTIFATLAEGMVDFAADTLEKIASDMNEVSHATFRHYGEKRIRNVARLNRRLKESLIMLGGAGERLSQIRESLLSLQRIVTFATDKGGPWISSDVQARLKTASQDLQSLADFEIHLSNKVQFLLDAVLGFINTEQNDIFKVLTIVSVVGIPPTLIASMYGMNFHNMPELSWPWGYQYGLAVIAASTLLPILWFKWRGWW